MNITKEQFERAMKTLQDQMDIYETQREALDILFPDSFVSPTILCLDGMMTLLSDLTNDVDDLICQFVFECDFGRNDFDPNLTIDEKHYPLKTVDDLLNILSVLEK